MLHSNYNTLTLPNKIDGKYKIGDTYESTSRNWREMKFNGLQIKKITYAFGVVLHFDYNDWKHNNKSINNDIHTRQLFTSRFI